jgi:dTDP-4-amino-4,6-dideoxy-D-glucose transaminase
MFDKPYELVSPLLPDAETLFPDVREALASKWLTHDGPFVRRLELAMSDVLNAPHVVAVSNGTAGLMVAIRAMGWRGEVITPAFGFAGTAHALTWAGCTPVLAEVRRDTLTVDPASVERLVGPATIGILPVDAFGMPADLDALRRAGPDLPILVDAAHALGSTAQSPTRPVARVYSLHPTKTLVAGEGGLLATTNRALADRLRRLRNFGFGEDQNAFDVGLNAKLPELSAVLAYHQIGWIERTIEGRKAWDAAYRESLEGVPGIRFQVIPASVTANYQYTPVLIDAREFGRTRDEVAGELHRRNIVTRAYFWPPIHVMDPYRSLRTDDLRWTERLSASVLCLPVHPAESPAIASEIGELIRSLRQG